MYEKIDEFIASILHIPLSFFCKLTGRSNYFFAKATMICSMLLHMFYYSYLLSLGKFGIVDGFLWPINFVFCIIMILLFRLDQRKVESSSTTIIRSQFAGHSWLFFRVFVSIMNSINIFIDLLGNEKYIALSALALLLWAIAVYFAADTTPRGKGWFRQKAESLARTIKNIKVPSLNPAPPPIPT